jgi:predicted nucleotidyltransferase
MSLDEIKRILASHKPELAERFLVCEIGVFGSFARGEEDEGSDVDILVEFSEPVGFFTFLELEEHLRDLLGRKVDLVSKKALKPRIGGNILRELVTI